MASPLEELYGGTSDPADAVRYLLTLKIFIRRVYLE